MRGDSSRGMPSFGEVQQRQSKRRGQTLLEQSEEARRLLPSEPLPFVMGAVQALRFAGLEVTADSVRARLKAQGRTKAQLGKADAA